MKLVLIDDEPFHLIGMQTVIPWEQSQFIIAGEARSGEEGIELILREQPDIAIVDIVMPGIDGLEMIRRVKDAAPETRFIVLSCMNDIQRYKEAVSLGAAEYLQKDLATPDVLLETVRRVAQQLKRERLRNSDGEAHADTAPQLRTEYLNLLLSGTAENLRTAPYQLEKWGLLKRGAPFTVGLLTVQMPDTGSQRAQPPYAGIIAIAQEIFCREGSSCFFRTAGRNIAALLPALSPERMEKAFSRLQSMAESSIDCILSMGISETANDARQIPALYEHAHQACASAYYDGHGKLYRFSASPARHTAGRPAYKRTNTFSAAALHAELDALTVHLKNARPQLPQAAAQLTAFIQRTILLAEQTGIIAGADEVSGDEIAKSCASAAELSLAAAGIHRLIDVLDARRSQSQPDTYRGLILVTGTIGIPSSIMLLSSSFRSIPNELLEAAAIDGCGYFRKIFHIMIPMGKPAIAICTIMGFISSWNDLLPPMVIIKSVNKRLVMPALDGLVSMYNADTPFQLTGILIAAVPAIAIYLILSKQIIMGISAGSTK